MAVKSSKERATLLPPQNFFVSASLISCPIWSFQSRLGVLLIKLLWLVFTYPPTSIFAFFLLARTRDIRFKNLSVFCRIERRSKGVL